RGYPMNRCRSCPRGLDHIQIVIAHDCCQVTPGKHRLGGVDSIDKNLQARLRNACQPSGETVRNYQYHVGIAGEKQLLSPGNTRWGGSRFEECGSCQLRYKLTRSGTMVIVCHSQVQTLYLEGNCRHKNK